MTRDPDRLARIVDEWRPRDLADLERVRRVVVAATSPSVAAGVIYWLVSYGTGAGETPRTTAYAHARRLEHLHRPALRPAAGRAERRRTKSRAGKARAA